MKVWINNMAKTLAHFRVVFVLIKSILIKYIQAGKCPLGNQPLCYRNDSILANEFHDQQVSIVDVLF